MSKHKKNRKPNHSSGSFEASNTNNFYPSFTRRKKDSKFGGREPKSSFQRRTGPIPINPFELFCLYYLGVTDDNSFKRPTMKDTAKRIGIQPEQVELALRACGMDKHTLRDVNFDMKLAQEDIRVAPEGIDKREIAKTLFDDFIEHNPHFIDKTHLQIAEELGLDIQNQ